jgi:membrane dipeptidase
MSELARLLDGIAENADIACVVTSVGEIEQARAAGKLGVILGAQDSTFLQHDVGVLAVMQRIGFRILQPTYMEQNALGCGVVVDVDTGLTSTGHSWVERMNALNLLIDLSHVGYRTAADVVAASRRPVHVSHGNARALCDSVRNLPDELVRAVADKGGTIGATLWPPILRHDQRPSIEDFGAQIQCLVNLAGVEHVAFGSDLSEGRYKTVQQWETSFGPRGLYPTVGGAAGPWFTFENRVTIGFESMAYTSRLTDALLRRQLGEDAVEKIMGENLLRVYREAWGA